jgi:hypothetical protein
MDLEGEISLKISVVPGAYKYPVLKKPAPPRCAFVIVIDIAIIRM